MFWFIWSLTHELTIYLLKRITRHITQIAFFLCMCVCVSVCLPVFIDLHITSKLQFKQFINRIDISTYVCYYEFDSLTMSPKVVYNFFWNVFIFSFCVWIAPAKIPHLNKHKQTNSIGLNSVGTVNATKTITTTLYLHV